MTSTPQRYGNVKGTLSSLNIRSLSPTIVEISRETTWFPFFPKTTWVEYVFTDAEAAKKFRDLRDERDEFSIRLAQQDTALKTLRAKLKDAEAKLSEVNQLKRDVQSITKRHNDLKKKGDRWLEEIQGLRTKVQQANSENIKALNAANRSEQKYQQAVSASERKERQLMSENDRLNQELNALRQEMKQAEESKEHTQRLLKVLPELSGTPFGVERALQDHGVEIQPITRAASYPPLAGPTSAYTRPTLDHPQVSVRGLCMSKERENVQMSQDAMAFEVRDDELYLAVADGVTSSSRSREWAHRIARASLSRQPVDALERAQTEHREAASLRTKLAPARESWMAKGVEDKPGQATLVRMHQSQSGSIELQRKGDVWGAVFVDDAWNIIMDPSTVNATTAIDSHQPIVFDEDIVIDQPQRMLLMTDGVNPASAEGLEALWNALHEDDESSFDGWLRAAADSDTFADDDVSVVAIDFRGA